MSQVQAIFSRGVFKPLEQVRLSENQRVQLHFEPVGETSEVSWLARVRHLQQQVSDRQGCLPDSTLDISADRTR